MLVLIKSQIRWEAALPPDKEAKGGQTFTFSFYLYQLDIPAWIWNLEEYHKSTGLAEAFLVAASLGRT